LRNAAAREQWSKLRSTNPLERVNREIGRRTDMVGIRRERWMT
jgi:transposase-like protein